VTVRSSSLDLDHVFRVTPSVSTTGENGYYRGAEFDLLFVPTGDDVAVGFEISTLGVQGRGDNDRRMSFPIIAPTDVATMRVLLLPGKADRDLRLVMYDRDQRSVFASVDRTYRFDMEDDRCSAGWSLDPTKTTPTNARGTSRMEPAKRCGADPRFTRRS
jgi:hypothetical protein